MYSLWALLGGLLVLCINVCNAELSTESSLYTSSLIYHCVGLFVCTLIIKFNKQSSTKVVPIYYYTAGAFSVLTIVTCNYCIGKMGAAVTISLGLIGQLILSTCIDHFGWFKRKPFALTSQRFIGVAIMITGAFLMGGA